MASAETPITVLVLAGKRGGTLDPLAERAGTTHKCLVPVGGKPLIEHLLATLDAAPEATMVIVSIDDVGVLDHLPTIRSLKAQGRLRITQAQPNLADSIFVAAEDARFPLLITTADNALFTHAALSTMAARVRETGAEIAAAFARKDAVLAAHPEGQRRFYAFADDGYSNCNCYWIDSRDALSAANIFRSGGQFSKHPMRIAQAFGILNLIRFRLGIGTLENAFARFSKRLRKRMRPVIFDDGSLAIDVDNERTYRVVETIMAQRAERTMGRAA
ncbi:NTP transferase domain-containing protein [Flavisphingomonas formosensis]|uniref:NTP transferase domain-containing protein n=1 Tax=Flavisphingomonas formosensis TaxID=861534 RepID=UPI0012F82F92|nr:NTP transferase domain-containing protein [Sphingomonas formosensis]